MPSIRATAPDIPAASVPAAPLLAVPFVAVLLLAALLAAGMLSASPARAWQAHLGSHPNLPATFLAIDKNDQRFFIYTRQSPLKKIRELPCATGQAVGDKTIRGDLKTPEGLYFISRRLTKGLNYDLYGDQAFTLNYPNPVDRIRGKTGSGIWIHGRGQPVTNRETKGCVALNTPDLAAVQDILAPGTPVAIAQTLSVDPASRQDELDELVEKVQGWAKSWADKSPEFFSYYASKPFSASGGKSFSHFKRRKKRIFQSHEWIEVMADDVRAMAGPDYWVTWFNQYYRTPTMTTQGVKRLYWQKTADGGLRIVGREWQNREIPGLERRYLDRTRAKVGEFIAHWRQAWLDRDVQAYAAHYAPGATQGDRQGLLAITRHKKDIWAQDQPVEVEVDKLSVTLHPQGVMALFRQGYLARSGYADLGLKTMVLAPAPGGWKIISEDWRSMDK